MDPDRAMRNMMQGMGMNFGFFDDPFGFGGGSSHGSVGNNGRSQHHPNDPMSSLIPGGMLGGGLMSPFMMNPFQSMQQAMSMAQNGTGNGFSYCSSSVTSYTTDEHGRPQVYQQSNEIKQGPNGVKETKSSLRDSRSGKQELAIGHHLKDKAHIKKKAKNVYTGEEEQAEDFVNIEESEAETFEQTWQRQAQNAMAHNQLHYLDRPSRTNRLALTGADDPEQHHHSTIPAQEKVKKEKKKKKNKDDNKFKWF